LSEVWAAAAAAVVGAGASYGLSKLGSQSGAPAVPYQNIDPTAVQNAAISGDQSSLAAATALGGSITNSSALQSVAARNITQPGYSSLAGSLSSDASALAANPYQVPQSVVDQLGQYAAENNIGEGTGAASGFSQSNLLRSLGINSLQYGAQNLASATSALSTLSGTAPNISPTSPLSFLLTPSQALQTATTNATNNQQINQGAANSATAAANANSSNLFDSLTGAIGQSGLSSATQAYLTSTNQSGVGAPTSYAAFLANNPNSSAAQGTGPAPGSLESAYNPTVPPPN
jgi:hypothetical protein